MNKLLCYQDALLIYSSWNVDVQRKVVLTWKCSVLAWFGKHNYQKLDFHCDNNFEMRLSVIPSPFKCTVLCIT